MMNWWWLVMNCWPWWVSWWLVWLSLSYCILCIPSVVCCRLVLLGLQSFSQANLFDPDAEHCHLSESGFRVHPVHPSRIGFEISTPAWGWLYQPELGRKECWVFSERQISIYPMICEEDSLHCGLRHYRQFVEFLIRISKVAVRLG